MSSSLDDSPKGKNGGASNNLSDNSSNFLDFEVFPTQASLTETSLWHIEMADACHISWLSSLLCLWQTVLIDPRTLRAQMWPGIHFSRVHRLSLPDDWTKTFQCEQNFF